MCHNVCVYTALYSVYCTIYSAVHGIHFTNMVFAQANSKHCSGCVRLDINLLKPSRIEFTQDPTDSYTQFDTARSRSILPNVVGVRISDGSSDPAMSRIWWAEFLLCHCFWLVTRLQQSLIYSASARIQASRMAVPTRLQRTDGGAAMSMRSTRGCGSLGAASPAWEA